MVISRSTSGIYCWRHHDVWKVPLIAFISNDAGKTLEWRKLKWKLTAQNVCNIFILDICRFKLGQMQTGTQMPTLHSADCLPLPEDAHFRFPRERGV